MSHLLMLGSPAARTEAEPLALDLPSSLLFYLAHRGTWVSRSELAFLYRADVSEAQALAYLRKLIYRARRLGWADGLEVTPERLRWRVSTDVQRFEEAVETQNWQAATDLYRGPFLEGLEPATAPGYTAWLELERSTLLGHWTGAVRKLAESLETRGEVAEALSWLSKLARHDPYDETTLQVQLSLLAKDQQGVEALKRFEAFRECLERDMGVAPLESTQALVDSIRQSVKFAQAPRPNLPADTTRFVGRSRELKLLETRFVEANCRLVTLVGLGGTGKTRLALAFGRSQKAHYRDGVVFVALAGTLTPDSAVANIADALGLTLMGSAEPAGQVSDFLRERQLLLVLDNFEHLKDHASLLERFLKDAPELRLLVTSREALELRSESVLDVRGLAFPYEAASFANAEAFEAVELFLSRSERASGHFVRSAESVRAAAEIARRVEGLPLALELSASWTRQLSCREVLSALKTPALLSAELKHVPERQRSVTHIFETSLAQLSEAEQDVLLRLSFFDGGFDLAAAREVAAATLPLLLSLMNHSLVGRRGEDRYALHELLRQHLNTKLSPALRQKVAGAHSRYYLTKLARHGEALVGLTPRRAREALLVDVDNIRQATREGVKSAQWGQLERAFSALQRLLFSGGLFKVAEGLFEQLLTLLGGLDENETLHALKIQARLGLARARTHLGTTETADLTALRDDLASYGSKAAYAEALFLLGRNCGEKGQLDEGAALFIEGLEVLEDQAPSAVEMDLLEGVAMMRWAQGDYEGTVSVLRRWLALAQTLKDAAAIVTASQTLANRLRYIGDPDDEREGLLRSALAYQDEIGPHPKAGLLNDHALSLLERGDAGAAESLLRQCLDLATRTGDRHENAVIAYNLAKALSAQERFNEATAMFERSVGFAKFGSLQYAGLAETERLRGRYAKAKRYLLEALISYQTQPHAVTQVLEALISLARLYADEGRNRAAFELAAFVLTFEGSGYQQKSATEALYLELKRDCDVLDVLGSKPLDILIDEQISALHA